jgi:ATP adenylyltransferase
MDRLWAPWRAQYIRDSVETTKADPGCFLCRSLAAPQEQDRENLVLWRRPASVVVLNRFPYNNGHLLIAPLAHRGTLGELTGRDLTEPVETMKGAISVLDRILGPQGYNVGLNQGKSAGAGLPGHLHWHVVPRWDGDTNFMPILVHTKVIIESLHELYDRFLTALESEEGPETFSAAKGKELRDHFDRLNLDKEGGVAHAHADWGDAANLRDQAEDLKKSGVGANASTSGPGTI